MFVAGNVCFCARHGSIPAVQYTSGGLRGSLIINPGVCVPGRCLSAFRPDTPPCTHTHTLLRDADAFSAELSFARTMEQQAEGLEAERADGANEHGRTQAGEHGSG